MKTTVIALLLTITITLNAQPVWLKNFPHFAVSGVVITVGQGAITVSNTVTITRTVAGSATASYGGDPRFAGRSALTVRQSPARTETVTVPSYTCLRDYPQWRSVRVGDRMEVSAQDCYLTSDCQTFRTAVYYKAESSAVKVWR